MTGTPMAPDRARMIRIWHEELHRLTDPTAVARREALGDLLAEVDRLRGELSDATAELAENARAMNVLRRHRDTAEARVTELEALKPARFQDCQVCGAGYEYGQKCSACEFNKQMAAATAEPPAYRSQPLPPRDALCTCGHTGLDHHHSETSCWATLPRTQQRNGAWSAVPTCDCTEFEAAP